MTDTAVDGIAVKETSSRWKDIVSFLRKHVIPIAMTIALVLGIGVAIALKFWRKDGIFTRREVMYVSFLGDTYIRALQLIGLPLIFICIVSSLTSVNLRFAGELCIRTFVYFIITNILAVLWGIFLVLMIRPGKGAEIHEVTIKMTAVHYTTVIDTMMDIARAIFPQNYVEACFRSSKTNLMPPMVKVPDENVTERLNPDGSVKQEINTSTSRFDWEFEFEYDNTVNFLGICTFSIAFGIAAIVVTTSTPVISEFFEALNNVILTIVSIIVWASPVCVFSLVCGRILEEQRWVTFLGQFAWYLLTFIIGIVAYGFIFLQLVYLIITRKNPIPFTCNMFGALTTAFSTASSLATLPVTISDVVKKNGIPAPLANFVVPLGVTFNKNGSAIYNAITPLFIAQVLNRKITFFQVVLTGILSTIASVGTAGVQQVGPIQMVMELSLFNLEREAIVYVVIADWLMDHIETVLNVYGDAIAAAVVFASSKEQFEQYQRSNLHPLYMLQRSTKM